MNDNIKTEIRALRENSGIAYIGSVNGGMRNGFL